MSIPFPSPSRQLTGRNAREVAFKTILITGLNIPAKLKKSDRLTVLDAKRRIKLTIACPPEEQVEITIKQEKMNELAEAIKRWNEVERKRVMERLQPWADGRIAKGKTSGGGGGGCWGWLKGEGYKVSSRGLRCRVQS